MNLTELKNPELHRQLKNLVQEERKITHQILLHIVEVDRRKLYLSMAFPNLWEYMISLGYSAASAQRRIDAARLMAQVPEVGQKIEQGTVTLSQISLLQKTVRQQKIPSGQKDQNLALSLPELVQKMENKSTRETELMLAQEFDIPLKLQEKKTIQKDESVRIELTLTQEQWQHLQEAQALLSHSLESNSLSAVIDKLAVRCIEQKKTRVRTNPVQRVSTSAGKVVLQRDQCCQFVDKTTGKKCNSKYFLQTDHVHPKWAGGSNDISNLRTLCAAHNRFRYKIGA